MTAVLFDPARHDAGHLAVLHRSAFADPWDSAAIAALLAGPGVFAFFQDDGFVMGRSAGGEGEILTLAVTPASRGRGIGRALLIAAAAQAGHLGAQTLFLEVGKDNPAALALYAGLGFTERGRRKAYYAKPGGPAGDALVLGVQLPLSPPRDFA